MNHIPEHLKCIVKTGDGPICGLIEHDGNGTYYKFKSIPYAKPPIQKLRFLPPQPVAPWTDIKDCTQPTPISLSYDGHYNITGSEDCLYLEISSPNVKPETPMPVMFWIGCYEYSCTLAPIIIPSLINDENVVFVFCGFRLGPFGFFAMNDFMAPGNLGLKDIVLALKWVHKNIHIFGGDKNNVTIAGNSSGGTLAHLMMLSPMSTGLFQKAIIQSASSLNPWAVAKNPMQSGLELAKEIGITQTHPAEIIEEMKSLSSEKIMTAFMSLVKRAKEENVNNLFNPIFKPCIEAEFEGQSAFLTKSPHLIIKSGNFNKVPMIIGNNSVEGAVVEYWDSEFYSHFEKFNQNLRLIVPKSLAGQEKFDNDIGKQLLKFYLGENEVLTKDTKNQYLQMISDYYFLYYVNKTVRLHTVAAPEYPIYYYVINFAGEWQVPHKLRFFNMQGDGSEIPYIFPLRKDGGGVIKGSNDCLKIRRQVVKMWTNFLKYGNPTPIDDDPLLQITWEPVESKDKLNFLSIASDLTKGRNPFYDRMAFWEELHKKHTFLRVLVHFNDIGVIW